jgi:hypothetical protein
LHGFEKKMKKKKENIPRGGAKAQRKEKKLRMKIIRQCVNHFWIPKRFSQRTQSYKEHKEKTKDKKGNIQSSLCSSLS